MTLEEENQKLKQIITLMIQAARFRIDQQRGPDGSLSGETVRWSEGICTTRSWIDPIRDYIAEPGQELMELR